MSYMYCTILTDKTLYSNKNYIYITQQTSMFKKQENINFKIIGVYYFHCQTSSLLCVLACQHRYK